MGCYKYPQCVQYYYTSNNRVYAEVRDAEGWFMDISGAYMCKEREDLLKEGWIDINK